MASSAARRGALRFVSDVPVEPACDVRKDLGFVRLHQQLMAGAGIELRLDVPDADVPEALDGPPDSGGALAYRVGVTGEEEQGQALLGIPARTAGSYSRRMPVNIL